MKVPPPPYLIEYRVARIFMRDGNIGPNTLVGMLDRGEAFLFAGDRTDYEKCSHCNALLKSHKKSFLKADNGDLAWQGALSQKLIFKKKLVPQMHLIATDTIRLAGVAARKNLTCVVAPMGTHWNRCDAFVEGSVAWVSDSDFINEYAPGL